MTASVVTASIDDRVSSKLLKPEIIINHPNQQQQQKHLRFTLEIRVAHNFLKLSDEQCGCSIETEHFGFTNILSK